MKKEPIKRYSQVFKQQVVREYEAGASVYNLMQKYAKGWLILVLLALEVLFNAVILPQTQARLAASSGGTGPIDLLFFYTPEEADGRFVWRRGPRLLSHL